MPRKTIRRSIEESIGKRGFLGTLAQEIIVGIPFNVTRTSKHAICQPRRTIFTGLEVVSECVTNICTRNIEHPGIIGKLVGEIVGEPETGFMKTYRVRDVITFYV